MFWLPLVVVTYASHPYRILHDHHRNDSIKTIEIGTEIQDCSQANFQSSHLCLLQAQQNDMVFPPSPHSADEAQRRDVVRAAGPPQRVAEERGAGMPRRRRRDLAAVMANRRPQRDAVDHGKHFHYWRFISQCCQYILLQECTSSNAIRFHDFSSLESAP